MRHVTPPLAGFASVCSASLRTPELDEQQVWPPPRAFPHRLARAGVCRSLPERSNVVQCRDAILGLAGARVWAERSMIGGDAPSSLVDALS
jgi:hypothetical protein